MSIYYTVSIKMHLTALCPKAVLGPSCDGLDLGAKQTCNVNTPRALLKVLSITLTYRACKSSLSPYLIKFYSDLKRLVKGKDFVRNL